VDPESFAVEDMNRLLAQRSEAEAGQLLPIIAGGDYEQMIQNQIETGVSPAMKLPNAIDSEH